MRRVLLFFVLGILVQAACRPAAGADPGQVVQMYLQAKVDGDAMRIRPLLCSELEAEFEQEVHTFDTLSGARLADVSCHQQGADGLVRCQGSIIAVYGQEQSIFPLGVYRVVVEDGAWKWCGEAASSP